MKLFFTKLYGGPAKLPRWVQVVAGLLTILIIYLTLRGAASSDLPSATAKFGEFIVDLHETGRLRAENSVTVSAPPVRMSLQIVDMVPEGRKVEQGDFLIQFDTTEVAQRVDDERAELDIARSNLVSSLAGMKSNFASIQSSLENAKASHRLAELRLEQMKFEADVRIEEGQLSLKQSQISLEQAKQQVESQKQMDAAEEKLLKLKIRQAEIDLEKAIHDMNKLRITAPAPGLVVYKEMWKGGEMSKVKVGDTPWRGAALIELPDLSVMLVETSVNEVDISKVEVGQECEIKLDAYPDPVYHGKIIDVAVLASEDMGVSDAKVFKVLVRLDEADKLLRPGMSATTRIICQRIPDKVWVPIEAVFPRNGDMIVWKVTATGWKDVKVELGERNDNFVVIESGIEEGDRVALTDPEAAERGLDGADGTESIDNPANLREVAEMGRMEILVKVDGVDDSIC